MANKPNEANVDSVDTVRKCLQGQLEQFPTSQLKGEDHTSFRQSRTAPKHLRTRNSSCWPTPYSLLLLSASSQICAPLCDCDCSPCVTHMLLCRPLGTTLYCARVCYFYYSCSIHAAGVVVERKPCVLSDVISIIIIIIYIYSRFCR